MDRVQTLAGGIIVTLFHSIHVELEVSVSPDHVGADLRGRRAAGGRGGRCEPWTGHLSGRGTRRRESARGRRTRCQHSLVRHIRQSDDPDGDGTRNILEDFFGTDPLAPSPGVSTVHRAGNQFRMTYPMADQGSAGPWQPGCEISRNLGRWDPIGRIPASIGTEVDATRYQVFFNATASASSLPECL